MAYKQGIDEFLKFYYNNLSQGYETTLFAKSQDDNYFMKITENIGYVTYIGQKLQGELTLVKVRFANNNIFDVYAYIDNLINVGSIISSLGVFINHDGKLEYYNKFGMLPLYMYPKQTGTLNINKLYKMGYFELSEAKVSKVYFQNGNILQMKNNGLYYYVGDISNLKEKDTSISEIINMNTEKEEFTVGTLNSNKLI